MAETLCTCGGCGRLHVMAEVPATPEQNRCPACQAREVLSDNLPPEGPESSDTEATP